MALGCVVSPMLYPILKVAVEKCSVPPASVEPWISWIVNCAVVWLVAPPGTLKIGPVSRGCFCLSVESGTSGKF